jgi:phage antirepressor YoqD-like protein
MAIYYKLQNLLKQKLSLEHIAIAYDINTKASKRFRYYNINELDYKEDNHLYEVLHLKKQVKLFFDLEFTSNPEIVLPCLEKKIKEFFLQTFDEELPEPIIMDGGFKTKKQQHSFHYIYNTKKRFINIRELNTFMFLFLKFINDTPILHDKCSPVFDTVVYTKNRFFRLPYQTKKGIPRKLLPVGDEKNFHYYTIGEYKKLYETYDCEALLKSAINVVRKQSKISIDVFRKTTSKTVTLTYLSLKYPPATSKRQIKVIKTQKDILFSIPNKGKYYQPSNVWYFIGIICKNIGIKERDFHEWTGDNNYSYKDIRDYNYDEGMLIKLASIYHKIVDIRNIHEYHHIEKFDKEYSNKHLFELIKYPPHTMDIETHFKNIKIKQEWEGTTYKPYALRDLKHLKTLLIKSGLGTGKTYQIIANINSERYKSCIILTPRISFAKNIVEKLRQDTGKPFELYQNLRRDEFANCDWLVIQQESLFKLYDVETDTINKYELVCIDEVESIQTQMTSCNTNKNNMLNNLNCFEHLLKNSKLNILCDGFLTNRTINMVKDLELEYEVIHNKYINTEKTAEQIFKNEKITIDTIENFLYEKVVNQNKKMYCVISNKNVVNNISLTKFTKAGKSVKIYHGDLSDSDKEIKDVNCEWIKYDLILTTTTITVGIDFTEKHFDHGFIFGNYNCGLIRDLFQAIFRARKLSHIYYCFNNKITEQRRINMSDIVKNIDKRVDMVKQFYVLKQNHDFPELSISFQALKKWQRNILLYNLFEKEITYQHYSFMFEYYLKITGYHTNIKNYNQEYTNALEPTILPDYSDIRLLTEDEYKKVNNNLSKTLDEKYQCAKYLFNNLFINAPSNTEELFIEYYNNRTHFYNLYKEKYKSSLEVYTKHQQTPAEICSNDFLKLEIINTIKQNFNITNTTDKTFTINANEAEKLYDKLPSNIKNNIDIIYKTHKTKYTRTKLDKIFKDWCDTRVKMVYKKINNVRKPIIFLEPCDIYSGVYNNLKNQKQQSTYIDKQEEKTQN